MSQTVADGLTNQGLLNLQEFDFFQDHVLTFDLVVVVRVHLKEFGPFRV